jgi:hypothetical protein
MKTFMEPDTSSLEPESDALQVPNALSDTERSMVVTKIQDKDRYYRVSQPTLLYQLEASRCVLKFMVSLYPSSTPSTLSFQELRVECYAQSLVAQGKTPASVDAVTTPEAVIPPLFNAYPDETDDALPNEIAMTDQFFDTAWMS